MTDAPEPAKYKRVEEWLDEWYASSTRLNDPEVRTLVVSALTELDPGDACEFLYQVDLLDSVRRIDPERYDEKHEYGLRMAYIGLDDPRRAAFGGSSRSLDRIDEQRFKHWKFREEVQKGHLKFPGMQYWLRWSDISKSKTSVIVGLTLAQLTSSASIGALSTFTTAIVDNIKKMSDEEVEVYYKMKRLMNESGRKSLTEDEIVNAMPPGETEHSNRELLSQMVERGFLSCHAGVWKIRK